MKLSKLHTGGWSNQNRFCLSLRDAQFAKAATWQPGMRDSHKANPLSTSIQRSQLIQSLQNGS